MAPFFTCSCMQFYNIRVCFSRSSERETVMKRDFWRETETEVFYLFEVLVCFLQMGLTLMLAFKVLSLSEGNIWLFHPDPTVKTAGST